MVTARNKEFFSEQLWQSRIKSEIVAKYFWAWGKNAVKVSKRTRNPIAFMDLYCGPGRYDDGNPSTPILILDSIAREPDFLRWVRLIFNDQDQEHVGRLRAEIASHPASGSMHYAPEFRTEKVGEEIIGTYATLKCPVLSFLDPFGYGGLSREVIGTSVQGTLRDTIFFFSYPWINRHLSNPILHAHTHAMFGAERARILANEAKGLRPAERELLVLERFRESLIEVGVTYPLFLKVRHRKRDETSHYIGFATTHPLAVHIMKNVMGKYSTRFDAGVPLFEFDPRPKNEEEALQLSLDFFVEFPNQDSIGRLMDELAERYAGCTMSRKQIYFDHGAESLFLEANYREALLRLEAAGRVEIQPPAHLRPRYRGGPSLQEDVPITFPMKTDP